MVMTSVAPPTAAETRRAVRALLHDRYPGVLDHVVIEAAECFGPANVFADTHALTPEMAREALAWIGWYMPDVWATGLYLAMGSEASVARATARLSS